jgi:hypothetical protein
MPRSSRKVEINTVYEILKFMNSIDAILAIPVWFMSLYVTSFYSLWLMVPVTSLMGLYLYYTVENYRWAFDMAKSLASDAMARAALWSSGSSSRTRSSGRRPARGSSPRRQSGWGGAPVEESLLPSMRYDSGNPDSQPAKRAARGRSPGRPAAEAGARAESPVRGGARAKSPGRGGARAESPVRGGVRAKSPGRGGARAESPVRPPAEAGARTRSRGRGNVGDKLPPRVWNSRTKTWCRPV